MNFNFTDSLQVGATRTRAKKVTIINDSIIYELENKVNMKDGTNKFYRIGSLVVDTTEELAVSNINIDTGVVLDTYELPNVMLDLNNKIKIILNKYTTKDFEPKTESGTSYSEVREIFINNDFNDIPSVVFTFDEVVVLSDGSEMRLAQDSLHLSMQMDITKTDIVKTFLQVNQSLFNIMASKANTLTEEQKNSLV